MFNYEVTHDDLSAFEELVGYDNSNRYVSKEAVLKLHPLDLETGMPSLPAGYYWRVYKNYSYDYVGLYFQEETVKKYKGALYFLTRKMIVKTDTVVRKISEYHISKTISDPVAAITEAATDLLSNLTKHMVKELTPVDYTKYYGTYPPKNLLTVDED